MVIVTSEKQTLSPCLLPSHKTFHVSVELHYGKHSNVLCSHLIKQGVHIIDPVGSLGRKQAITEQDRQDNLLSLSEGTHSSSAKSGDVTDA